MGVPPSERAAAPAARRSAPMVRGARLRAARVKALTIAVALTLFVASLVLARQTYAGHARHHGPPLHAPARFESIVQRDTVGVVAPPAAPESVQSSTS